MSLAEGLAKLVLEGDADHETFDSVLNQLETLLETKKVRVTEVATMIKSLFAAERHFRSRKRKAPNSSTVSWNTLLIQSQKLLTLAKEMKKEEATLDQDEEGDNTQDNENCLPKNVSVYLNRLKKDKKELYKNPPVLPPTKGIVEDKYVKEPTRDAKTGSLTFPVGKDASLSKLLKEFHPNHTPAEVLAGGAFGGTYFRTIHSSVNNRTYNGNEVLKDTLPDDWIKGLDKKKMLTSATYNVQVNRYGVKCGGSLGMWEVSVCSESRSSQYLTMKYFV